MDFPRIADHKSPPVEVDVPVCGVFRLADLERTGHDRTRRVSADLRVATASSDKPSYLYVSVYQSTKDLLSVLSRHSCVHAAVAKEIREVQHSGKNVLGLGHTLVEKKI